MKGKLFFSHDSDARGDEKIIKLRIKHDWEGYGLYWAILEKLREATEYRLSTDFNSIAFDLRTSNELIKSIVTGFGLFTIDGDQFYSQSLCDRMLIKDAKSIKAKEGAAAKWGNTAGDLEQANKKKRSERLAEARTKGTHTTGDWEEMKEFFGCCVRCGSTDPLVKDHIIPIYQGGSDGIDNIQPLCRSCNASKGAESVDHRVTFCTGHHLKMAAKWLRMQAFPTPSKGKESKGEERKENAAAREIDSGGPPQTNMQLAEGIAIQLHGYRPDISIEQALIEAKAILAKESKPGSSYILAWAKNIKSMGGRKVIMRSPFGGEVEWTTEQYLQQKDSTTYKFVRFESELG